MHVQQRSGSVGLTIGGSTMPWGAQTLTRFDAMTLLQNVAVDGCGPRTQIVQQQRLVLMLHLLKLVKSAQDSSKLCTAKDREHARSRSRIDLQELADILKRPLIPRVNEYFTSRNPSNEN